MRISINVAHHAWPEGPKGSAAQLERVVTAADEIGLDSVWVADHLLRADRAGAPDEAVLEAYETLGSLASHSERVRLGVMADAVAYRAPELLIRAVGALDALSGGRARLGIGAGYGEHAAGTPRSAGNAGSAERIEELLRLAHEMSQSDGTGEAPGARRRPPVLVGGTGDSRTLPLVARYSDACDLLDTPQGGPQGDATLRSKLDILAVHCRKLGRALGEVDTSVSTLVHPEATADEIAAHCGHFADLGLDHVVLVPGGPWTRRTLANLAAAAPAIRALGGQPETLPKITYIDSYRLPAVGARV